VDAVNALDVLAAVGRYAAQPVAHGDSFDHEHAIAVEDLTLGLDLQRFGLELDSTRLQRARERARQSAAGRGHDVVERRGLRREVAGLDAVVIGDLGVDAELNRLSRAGRWARRCGPPRRSIATREV